MNTFFEKLIRLIYPKRCIFCRKEISGGSKISVCIDCLMELTSETGYIRYLNDGRKCIYALRYSAKGVSSAIKRFKFNNLPQYAETLGELMYLALKDNADGDIISYVPISPLRKIKRGYDQSRLLAEYVSKRMNIPMVPTLQKIRHNRKQSTLDEFEKIDNVKGVYRIKNKNIHGKRIMLIDDVVTTGSTITECGRVLNEAGAGSIIYAAAASASKR